MLNFFAPNVSIFLTARVRIVQTSLLLIRQKLLKTHILQFCNHAAPYPGFLTKKVTNLTPSAAAEFTC